MLEGVTGAIRKQNVFVADAQEPLDAAMQALQDALDREGVEEKEEEEAVEGDGTEPGTSGSRSSDSGASAGAGHSNAGPSVVEATKRLENSG